MYKKIKHFPFKLELQVQALSVAQSLSQLGLLKGRAIYPCDKKTKFYTFTSFHLWAELIDFSALFIF